jgi:hypothetical protein
MKENGCGFSDETILSDQKVQQIVSRFFPVKVNFDFSSNKTYFMTCQWCGNNICSGDVEFWPEIRRRGSFLLRSWFLEMSVFAYKNRGWDLLIWDYHGNCMIMRVLCSFYKIFVIFNAQTVWTMIINLHKCAIFSRTIRFPDCPTFHCCSLYSSFFFHFINVRLTVLALRSLQVRYRHWPAFASLSNQFPNRFHSFFSVSIGSIKNFFLRQNEIEAF